MDYGVVSEIIPNRTDNTSSSYKGSNRTEHRKVDLVVDNVGDISS